jgi:hypothetical protein
MPCVQRPFKHCNPRSVEKKHYTNAQKTWALDFFAPYYNLHKTRRKTRSPFKDAFRVPEGGGLSHVKEEKEKGICGKIRSAWKREGL